MQFVPTVAILDVLAMGMSLLVAAYEAWLYRRGKERRHLWSLVMSLSCAAYAATIVVHYGAVTDEQGAACTRAGFVNLTLVVFAYVHLVAAYLRKSLPWLARLALYVPMALGLVLLPTDLIVTGEIDARELVLSPIPFLRAKVSLGLGLFEAYGLAAAIATTVWLFRARRSVQPEVRPILITVSLWMGLVLAEMIVPVFGVRLLFNLSSVASAIAAFGFALSDVRAHMAMLDTSRRDFRDLVDHAPDGIALVVGGRIDYANPALSALVGGQPLVGQSLQALMDERDERLVKAAQGASTPVEITLRPSSGPLTVEATAIAISTGQPAVLLVLRDVTAHRQLTAKTIEMDRMLTMGTLAAAVGHEINNPLSYTLLNLDEAVELLRNRDLPDVPALRDRVQRALGGAKRIRDTIRSLGFLSRRRTKRDSASVERVISTAVNLTRNEIALRAQLRVRVQPDLYIEGDETRVVQVLVNLLVNAAHAIEEGDTEHNVVEVMASSAGQLVRLQVSDTGRGIAPDDRERIFQPFFTTKPDEGSGLGLYIVSEAVRSMGGSIEVSPHPERGTSFAVTLPRGEPSARVSTIRPRPLASTRARVLIVDDEPELSRALVRALRPHADCVAVGGTAEALSQLEQDQDYDMILTDVMMPNGSGPKLFETIVAHWPELRAHVVFMTGGAFTPAARAFLDRTDRPVLEKPIDIPELVRLVQSLRRPQRESGEASAG